MGENDQDSSNEEVRDHHPMKKIKIDNSNEEICVGEDPCNIAKTSSNGNIGEKWNPEEAEVVLKALKENDIGPSQGVKVGSSIEVLWYIHVDQDADANTSREDTAANISDEIKKPEATVGLEGEGDGEVSNLDDLEAVDTSSEDENVESVWWPARVVAISKDAMVEHLYHGQQDACKLPKYTLMYEAKESFAPEERDVCLIDERALKDIQDDQMLYWRVAGSTWTPEDMFTMNEDVDNTQSTTDDLSQMEIRIPRNPEDIHQTVVDFVQNIIEGIISKHMPQIRSKPAFQQQLVVRKVNTLREQLIQKMEEVLNSGRDLDHDTVQELIAQYFSKNG